MYVLFVLEIRYLPVICQNSIANSKNYPQKTRSSGMYPIYIDSIYFLFKQFPTFIFRPL